MCNLPVLIIPIKKQCFKPKVSYLVDFGPLASEPIPQNDSTLIVAAGQKVLMIAAPADTAATNKVPITFT